MTELFAYLPSSTVSKHGWSIYACGNVTATINSGSAHLYGEVNLKGLLDKEQVKSVDHTSMLVVVTDKQVLVESGDFTPGQRLAALQAPPPNVKQVITKVGEIIFITQEGSMSALFGYPWAPESFIRGIPRSLHLPFNVVQYCVDQYSSLFLSASGVVYSAYSLSLSGNRFW